MLISAVKNPATAILVILVLISSIIFEDDLPLVPIGIGSFHVTDVVLLILLVRVFFKAFVDKDYCLTQSSLNLPLGLFYVYSMITAYASVKLYGMEFNVVIKALRPITYYLLYYLVTNLVRQRSQIEFLIKGMLIVAATVAIAMLVQALVGDSIKLIPGRVEESETLGQSYGALRLLPPGQTLLFVLFITTVCIVAIRKINVIYSLLYTTLIGLLGAGIMMTYNRTYWVAITFAMLILFTIIPLVNKYRLLKMSMVCCAMLFLVLVSGMTNKRFTEYIESVTDRYFSLVSGKDLTESASVSDRFLENEYAIDKIIENPVFGIGLNNDYRPEIYEGGDDLRYYVHNGYLWILVDMGIIGLLLFMWFYVGFIIRCWRAWKFIEDDYFRAVVLGAMLSGVGIIPMVFFNPIFLQWFSIVVLAIIIGLSDSIICNNDRLVQDGE